MNVQKEVIQLCPLAPGWFQVHVYHHKDVGDDSWAFVTEEELRAVPDKWIYVEPIAALALVRLTEGTRQDVEIEHVTGVQNWLDVDDSDNSIGLLGPWEEFVPDAWVGPALDDLRRVVAAEERRNRSIRTTPQERGDPQ